MSNKSGTSSQVISLPKGGGALHGMGETFSPDLHTGTGNFTVPIALPPGRNGFQPQLNLVYSTGNGNGAFGLGWSLSVPGVSRKTSKGIPRYDDARDTFILSGAEDLVRVGEERKGTRTRTRYRPRTEGLFARIEHHHVVHKPSGAIEDYWEVRSKDGLVSFYGTLRPDPADTAWEDPAIIADPDSFKRDNIFAWKLTQTVDPFGNQIVYEYERDRREDGPHHWDQLYLSEIRYVDYGNSDSPQFLVTVRFTYEDRLDEHHQELDPFSDYRAGFEIRMVRRCSKIEIFTHDQPDTLTRSYQFVYLDQRGLAEQLPLNRASLLSQVRVVGHDGNETEELPPLEFGYTRFEPERRDFFPITGSNMPPFSLGHPDYELVDLFGSGLPDVLEMNGTVRYWRNCGDGRFDLPREMRSAPAGVRLADPGVQFIDANGDSRIDLLVTLPEIAGYYPLQFDGMWDRKSFQRYRVAPSFNLEDPEVRLIDLDGDGVTDAIRSGNRFELFFNDPKQGWEETRWVERKHDLKTFPDINFSDPRVKWADMTGDGLQDIVLVYDGNVEYWPNLGYGNWGKRITMRSNPHFPYGYEPRRILIGDVDGDGLADIVYVDDKKVTLWINQGGNGWSAPIVIKGTPPVTDMDSVRLADMLGSGVSGVLWSTDADGVSRQRMWFLDFTGGTKPYLLHEMDNHLGAVTRVDYAPSTRFYLEDQKRRETRWKTPLPFPVQVVARVEVIDAISGGKLTTEYSYHHGYWDGAEREFRGFGRVDQCDTETFEAFNAPGLHGEGIPFVALDDQQHFSPPTMTKTWFHQGPIGDEFGAWEEADLSYEYWSGDARLFEERPSEMEELLKRLPRRVKRDAIRALRGSILRSELYALYGTLRQERPYTVTESLYGVFEVVEQNEHPMLVDTLLEAPPFTPFDDTTPRIFFPHALAQRTTQWERGDEPMTQFAFTDTYDDYGLPHGQLSVAVPRGRDPRVTAAASDEQYLATYTETDYTHRDDEGHYLIGRVTRATTYEILNDGGASVLDFHANLLDDTDNTIPRAVIGQTLHYYDGKEFEGLPYGELGEYGALVCSESLVLTEDILHDAYRSGDTVLSSPEVPPYLTPDGTPAWTSEYPQVFRDQLPPHAGYTFHPGVLGDPFHEPGYYVTTEQRRYDVQTPGASRRGLLLATRDALGHETKITYTYDNDKYEFLPLAVTDPVGLTTKAQYDYRVLQPDVVTDANGNRTAFSFTPLGLVRSIAVMGKEGEPDGDTLDVPGARFEYRLAPVVHFTADSRFQDELVQEVISAGLRQAFAQEGAELSAVATVSVVDPDRTWLIRDGDERYIVRREAIALSVHGQPVFVRTIRRCHHVLDTDVPLSQRDETIETREYSDGFGRLLQTRTQAEEVIYDDPTGKRPRFGNAGLPAQQGQNGDAFGYVTLPGDPQNVVVSGWQVYDNKGRVVEKYEPFFAVGWDYVPPLDAERGQKATMFYDPRGHVVRTLNPDGSEQRVIYGVPRRLDTPDDFTPMPWEAYTYDANDLAPLSHRPDGTSLADRAPVTHHYTPSSIEIDALGRTIKAVARNRTRLQDGTLGPIEEIVTRSTYDIRGNQLDVTDALERVAFRHVYDLANRPLRIESIDAGVRRTVLDVLGNPVEGRDSKGALVLHAYDILNRPVQLWARDDDSGAVTLRERLIYGDDPANGLPTPQETNLLGKLYRHYDAAGLLTAEAYDFKGNLLEKTRQVIADAEILSTPNFRVDWEDPLDLEAAYQTTVAYDALNRVKTMLYPEDVSGQRKELRPDYNGGGALESVSLRTGDEIKPYVEHIAYNAKGQRALIAYGNGVMTRYAYDPQTFRLARLRSERYTQNGESYHLHGAPLQDFAYEYDLVSNITTLHDRTPNCGLPANPDRLDRSFTYDAIYRLTSANGREQDLQPPAPPWLDIVKSQDPTLVRSYIEQYQYDAVGNITVITHQAVGGSFNRQFALATGNDQLTSVTIGQSAYSYDYDPNGNLIRETLSRHFEWDYADRMRAYRTQPPNASPSVLAHYLYDASGQRVKKLVRMGALVEVTVYIDGIFEHHRQGGAQNNTLHVMDNQRRIALVRVGAPFPNDSAPGVQYHFGDHLGSSNVVVDSNGIWINREEYTPYGETSFGSFVKKRYRFTGKERDEESRLYYHGARYYAPWVGRWISCDPAGMVGSLNLYQYSTNNPLGFVDPSGTLDEPAITCTEPVQTSIDSSPNKSDDDTSNLDGSYPANSEFLNWNDEYMKAHGLGGQPQVAPTTPTTPKIDEGLRTELKRLRKDVGGDVKEIAGILDIVDRETIPSDKLDASKTNPMDDEHIKNVLKIINWATKGAAGESLKERLEDSRLSVTALRQKVSDKASESLVLRDAQYYLWGMTYITDRREEFGVVNYLLESYEALLAHRVYTAQKILEMKTGIGLYGQATQRPYSAPGGGFWYDFGVSRFQASRDDLDKNVVPLPVTSEQVNKASAMDTQSQAEQGKAFYIIFR